MRQTLAFLVALAWALPASAANVSVNTTLDLTLGGPNPPWAFEARDAAFSPAFSVDLAEGDSFDFTIDFLGDQTLTLTNMTFAWAFSYANLVSDVVGTGQMQLLDTDGQVLFASTVKTNQEGEVHFGQQFSGGEFTGLPTTFTIGGLRYTATVDDYIAPGVTTKTYAQPSLIFQADSAVVAVPEPATAALMLAGVAGLLAWRRRRAA
jgi:hypothetical protein